MDLPVLTDPLRSTICEFLENYKDSYFSAFEFDSFILANATEPNPESPPTCWAFTKGDGENLSIVDLLMATSAIPVVFPPQTISDNGQPRNIPTGEFIDGGREDAFKGFEDQLTAYFQRSDTPDTPMGEMYIISPMRDNPRDIGAGLVNNALKQWLETNTFYELLSSFERWNDRKNYLTEVFVCIPEMDENINALDFGIQREQYNEVRKWYTEFPRRPVAVDLSTFIRRHDV